MHEFQIRHATAGDAAIIAALEQASLPDPWNRPQIESALAAEHIRCLMAHDARGEIPGYILWSAVGREAEIYKLAVHPERRRRGTGAALIRAFFNCARSSGVTAAWLEVRGGNAPARALYAAHCFAVVAVRKKYYTDTGEDALILRAAIG